MKSSMVGYPDGELPKLIDHVIHNILTVTYNNGLYHEQKVLQILSKITPLDGFQIHAWFNRKRHCSDPPERQEFMTIQHQKTLGTWTDEKRTVLEKCFGEDICTPENFAFIGLLTGLSKNQISNWTRQKRYLLRKKGLLPPVHKSKRRQNAPKRRRRKGVSLNRKIAQKQRSLNVLEAQESQPNELTSAPSCDSRDLVKNDSPQMQFEPWMIESSPELQIPASIELPPDQVLFNLMDLEDRSNMDDISNRILQNAHQGGLFDDDEAFKLVALLADVEPSSINDWISGY